MIVRGKKKTVRDGAAMKKNVRDQKRVLADDDNESALSSLDDDEPLIPSEPIDQPMTGFFLSEDDTDHIPILRLKGYIPKLNLGV